MKTVSKTFNVYPFTELPQKIIDGIVKKNQDQYVSDTLKESMNIYFDSELSTDNYSLKITDSENSANYRMTKITGELKGYSLSHCQGDGVACFIDSFDIEELGLTFKIEYFRKNHYYTHENTYRINWINVYKNNEDYVFDDDTIEFIREQLTDMNKKLCNNMEYHGYRYIEDSSFIYEELSNDNETYYTIDGKVYHE